MDNMSLYQIDKNLKELLENGFVIDDETGEILFETEDLEKLEMSVENKINNIIGYIKDTKIQAENYEKVSKDYQKRSDIKKKKVERLEKYLSDYLQANDMTDKREYTNGMTSFRKSKKVKITSDIDLENYLLGNKEHKKYLKTKYSFDNAGLKKELLSGNNIPFCKIEENNNLQIK